MFGRKKLMLKLNNVILLLEWARVIPSSGGPSKTVNWLSKARIFNNFYQRTLC